MNLLQMQMNALENERDSVNLKFEYASKQLEKLEKTNVVCAVKQFPSDFFF